jgi:hypothetical protein
MNPARSAEGLMRKYFWFLGLDWAETISGWEVDGAGCLSPSAWRAVTSFFQFPFLRRCATPLDLFAVIHF